MVSSIDKYYYENRDPRIKGFPFVLSPFYLCAFLSAYIYIVKILGPGLMKNREPFQLRKVLIVYNFFQVMLSLFIFYEGGKATYLGNYNWRCENMDYSDTPENMRLLRVAWVCYISKWLDCLDTIFFVLRKKYNQISFLHLFHHSVMPFLLWIGLSFFCSGNVCFPIWINSFVHVVMYSYYGLSAFGPELQKIVNPFKKYLTILQMVQFGMIIAHASQALLSDCKYPKLLSVVELFYGSLFFVMFYNFYKHAYGVKKTA